MGLILAALAWGFAEATLFFIVPDVLLSVVAVWDRDRALRLCLWTLLGALAGGLAMYVWGSRDPASALAWLEGVPAVTPAMIDGVAADLKAYGSGVLFRGPLTGTPYKLYAALTASAGISPALFVLVSIPARLLRFVGVTLLAAWMARRFFSTWSIRRRRVLLLAVWAVFYLLFFLLMPG